MLRVRVSASGPPVVTAGAGLLLSPSRYYNDFQLETSWRCKDHVEMSVCYDSIYVIVGVACLVVLQYLKSV